MPDGRALMAVFDEKWMGECQTAELARLAASTSHLDGEVVEIGTWQGWSAIPIARAIAPTAMHVVDHWQGDASGSIPPDLLARPNKQIFLDNAAEAGVTIHVWDMDWRKWIGEWCETMPDPSIRFLHLDASHTRLEVRDNIEAVLPLMTPGGILAGDDWDWPEVEAGIRLALGADVAPEVQWDKLWIHRIAA